MKEKEFLTLTKNNFKPLPSHKCSVEYCPNIAVYQFFDWNRLDKENDGYACEYHYQRLKEGK